MFSDHEPIQGVILPVKTHLAADCYDNRSKTIWIGIVKQGNLSLTNDEAQDQETASYAYELLERLASLAGKNPAPSENFGRETVSPSAAKTTPTKSRSTSSTEGSPVHAFITKIDRMKTRQGDSLFLKVDVGGETVRVFGRPEELAERLEASGYDIPASEIEAGMELHLPILVCKDLQVDRVYLRRIRIAIRIGLMKTVQAVWVIVGVTDPVEILLVLLNVGG